MGFSSQHYSQKGKHNQVKYKVLLYKGNIRSLNPASSKSLKGLKVDIKQKKTPENTAPFQNFPCSP